RTAREMMTLYDARESAALADADHVHKAFALENIDQHAIADFRRFVLVGFSSNFERHFAHKLHRRQVMLLEVTRLRFGQAVFLNELDKPDLRRIVAVLAGVLALRHD